MIWLVAGVLAIGLALCARYRRWVETAIGVISGGIGLMLLVNAARTEVGSGLDSFGQASGKALLFLGGGLLMVTAFSAVIVGLVDRHRDASKESSTSSE